MGETKTKLILSVVKTPDGYLQHIIREGSRRHVIHWSKNGAHCSEPRCIINKRDSRRAISKMPKAKYKRWPIEICKLL